MLYVNWQTIEYESKINANECKSAKHDQIYDVIQAYSKCCMQLNKNATERQSQQCKDCSRTSWTSTNCVSRWWVGRCPRSFQNASGCPFHLFITGVKDNPGLTRWCIASMPVLSWPGWHSLMPKNEHKNVKRSVQRYWRLDWIFVAKRCASYAQNRSESI